MSDIQSKFHKMTKTIKEGYEEGVNKFQTIQEILDLKERVSQNESKRLELITVLGENYYLKYRNGEVQDDEIVETCLKIMEIDKKIFRDLKIIEKKNKSNNKNAICECGAHLTSEDKFCRSCGREVDFFEGESVEKISCPNCEEESPVDSKYCNCCGKKIS